MKKLVLAFLGCALVMNLVGCHGSNSGSKWAGAAVTPSEEAIIEVKKVVDAVIPDAPEAVKEAYVIAAGELNLPSTSNAEKANDIKAMVGGTLDSQAIADKSKNILDSVDAVSGIEIIPTLKNDDGTISTVMFIKETTAHGLPIKDLYIDMGDLEFDAEGKIVSGLEFFETATVEEIASTIKHSNGELTLEEKQALRDAYMARNPVYPTK